MSATAGVVLAGCGSSDNKTAKTVTETNPSTEASSTPTETTGTTSSKSSSSGNPLAGINPPAGSKKLGSKSASGEQWFRYSTNQSPASVISSYKSELSSAGWSVTNVGGHGGGWGPYGGSASGLSAKKGGDYVDVQAGGARGRTTFFEVCAGDAGRNACDNLSNAGNTSSGGSHPVKRAKARARARARTHSRGS